ncbi:MAG TPA: hypothetical protein QGF35_03040 [Dehalococcoidia bacterium]|nr:hypothetical protein [Dehalococcoidia bacterium]
MTGTRFIAAAAGFSLTTAALWPFHGNAAGDPPLPTEFLVYGTVEHLGANLQPSDQPVIALINGRGCGSSNTLLNDIGAADDPGKTVFVVAVVSSGTRSNEAEGCGTLGAPIRFYLPESGLLSATSLPFADGAQRFNLDFAGGTLTRGSHAILIANDGFN